MRTLALLVLLSSGIRKGADEELFSVTVLVNGLRNSTGILQVALYNRDGSIPDEHYENTYRVLHSNIRRGTAEVTFRGLPKDTYAVSILHDENVNGKIDRGLLLPKEGIGFSNIQSVGPRKKPSFSRAAFKVYQDTLISVKVIYL